MRVSELVKSLNEFISTNGDLEIVCPSLPPKLKCTTQIGVMGEPRTVVAIPHVLMYIDNQLIYKTTEDTCAIWLGSFLSVYTLEGNCVENKLDEISKQLFLNGEALDELTYTMKKKSKWFW